MKHQFKTPGEVITRRGHEDLHSGNLTEAKYEELVKEYPAYADHFEEVPEVKPTKVKSDGKDKPE